MKIQSTDYDIYFGSAYYQTLGNYIDNQGYNKIIILVDENTNEYCLPYFLQNLPVQNDDFEILEIPSGEENKCLEICQQLWSTLLEFKIDKKAILINLGGGMVSDLGGFLASVYKRGIDFINIPTTLLAMVDASVGGKNGINHDGIKNAIGSITFPKMVIIDTYFLNSLPIREKKSGIAEMVKHGLIADRNHFEILKNINWDSPDILKVIYHSVMIKNTIVMQDPYENLERKKLNFGHTLGHAIESLTNNYTTLHQPLLHGEAIFVGMLMEAYISYAIDLMDKSDYEEIKNTLKLLVPPIVFNENDIEICTNLLMNDKKNNNQQINFSLLTKIGHCVVNKNVEFQFIEKSFYEINQLCKN